VEPDSVTGSKIKERGHEKLNSATSIKHRIPIGLGKKWCRRTALFDFDLRLEASWALFTNCPPPCRGVQPA